MSIPTFDSLPVIFQWVLLTLACFRLTRIVTSDTWYPSEKFREYLGHKSKQGKFWVEVEELFTCPYCFGWWTTLIVFALAAQVISIPLPVLQAIAASSVVGVLGATFD